MFCKHCGNQLPDDAEICENCGQVRTFDPVTFTNTNIGGNMMDNQFYNGNNMQMPPQPTSGLAIASMVLGIIALVLSCFGTVGIICGLLAVILGGCALATKKGGKGMAIAGLVCGIIALVPSIIVVSIGSSLLSMI